MQTDQDLYRLLDAGAGQRLEQWGPYRLIRPEPEATWERQPLPEWQAPDALYQGRTATDGRWQFRRTLPESWPVSIEPWRFLVSLGTSKHTGVFPEQRGQWQLLDELIRRQSPQTATPVRYLNLFAYTGAASIVATKAGALTTHVDGSAPAIGRAKENQRLNNLSPDSIRWIREDVQGFVAREVRRGRTYDLISLDPPAFGHGAHGEQFRLERDLTPLLTQLQQLLSDQALGVIVTTYSHTMTPAKLAAICQQAFGTAQVDAKPLSLTLASTRRPLTTGSWALITPSLAKRPNSLKHYAA